MATVEKSEQSKFSFKNRKNWSNNRFAWVYAILILLAPVTLDIIFKMAGIYESMALRSINIFFIIIEFFILIWDYKRSKHKKTKIVDVFLLCSRTGFYY